MRDNLPPMYWKGRGKKGRERGGERVAGPWRLKQRKQSDLTGIFIFY